MNKNNEGEFLIQKLEKEQQRNFSRKKKTHKKKDKRKNSC